MCSQTHTRAAAQKIRAHNTLTRTYTPVYMYTHWHTHTQARVPDPNPGTHTFLIPHNCFQSKGSCLSGPRRGLIARYKILRRVSTTAGRQKEREGEREIWSALVSPHPSLSFHPVPGAGIWRLLIKGESKQTLREVDRTDSGGKHLSWMHQRFCQTQES